MKALYQAIRTRIEGQCPSIKWTRLFNNQFDRSNNDDPDKNNERAFRYPCCFIEFPGDNPISSSGYGAKRLDVVVRLHIGFESAKFEDLEVFDVVAEVQEALENWGTDGITPLIYLAQRMDYDHNNVYIYTLDYSTQYSDETVYVKRDLVESGSPLTLNVTGDLDLDNFSVRTGDGEI